MDRLTVAILDDQLPIKLTREARDLDGVDVVWSGQSADAMMDVLPQLRPKILVLQLEHLGHNPVTRAQLLATLAQAELTLVTYAFARREVLDSLRGESMRPIQIPLTVQALRTHLTGLVVRTLTAPSPPPGSAEPGSSSAVPLDPEAIRPPRYSLDRLAALESISTSVECECPRHLSSLLSSLAYFEAYSRDCESRSEEDADIHRMLYEHTARARMLLEQGLERTLRHEGIDV